MSTSPDPARPAGRSPSGEPLEERLRGDELQRLVYLCDAVFAIAITLAALDIDPPKVRTLGQLVAGVGPQLETYGVSFFVIAVFWWVNRALLSRLTEIDVPLTVLVLAMLCAVAVIPAATRGLYPTPTPGGRLFYALTMVAAGLVNCGTWLYIALRPPLRHEEVSHRYAWTRVGTTATVPAIFAVFLFVDGLPSWAAPAAMVLVLVIRRVVPRLTHTR